MFMTKKDIKHAKRLLYLRRAATVRARSVYTKEATAIGRLHIKSGKLRPNLLLALFFLCLQLLGLFVDSYCFFTAFFLPDCVLITVVNVMVVTNEISQSPVIENIWFILGAENCKSGTICAKNLTDVFYNRSARYICIYVQCLYQSKGIFHANHVTCIST